MYTFPATRRLVSRALTMPIVGPVAILVALNVVLLPYTVLRALANDGRHAMDGSRLENGVFAGSPTVHLQHALYSGGYGWLERLFVYIHHSWFVVPPLITLVVLLRWRNQIVSYIGWHTAVYYGGVICFMLFPMRPPWMAESGVVRILTLHGSSVVNLDNNPVAAMPSLHVALPLTLALWLLAHGHRPLGVAMCAYSAIVAFTVVFLGEHYVIDVLGAAALAASVSVVGVWFERRRTSPKPMASVATRLGLAPAGASERGQNLIEFAMLTPFVILFIAAIVVFGMAFNTRSSLQQAVREGARQVAVGVPSPEAQALAAGNAPEDLVPADVLVCLPTGSTGKIGEAVQVSVSKDVTLVPATGIFKALGASTLSVTMNPKATARLELTVSGVAPCPP
jgi:hypothetical protein